MFMSITTLSDWFETSAGRYLLEWEQAKFDARVADLFGYNAVQIGLTEFAFLRASRISHRFACAEHDGGQLLTQPHALPFASASIDLVLLPHVLEFSRHPHQVLREVERILVPEGNVIIAGFNPFSLFGLRRAVARSRGNPPWQGHYYSVMRIRDWMTLLGFETQPVGFGCYAPPVSRERWLDRWRFMDRVGGRWWPVCGGGYLLQGIKRVQGMRLITPKWRGSSADKKALTPVVRGGRGVANGTRKVE